MLSTIRRCFPSVYLFLVCCCVPAEVRKVRTAIELLSSLQSFEFKYHAELTFPKSSTVILDSDVIWMKPGITYTHFTATGGTERWTIKYGKAEWAYSPVINEWVTAEEMGLDPSDKSLVNVSSVISSVNKHFQESKLLRSRSKDAEFSVYDFEMGDSTIKNILKEILPEAETYRDLSFSARGTFQLDNCEFLKSLEMDIQVIDHKTGQRTKDIRIEVEVLNLNRAFPNWEVIDFVTGKPKELHVSRRIAQELEKFRENSGTRPTDSQR